jgi:hypothetical protein
MSSSTWQTGKKRKGSCFKKGFKVENPRKQNSPCRSGMVGKASGLQSIRSLNTKEENPQKRTQALNVA